MCSYLYQQPYLVLFTRVPVVVVCTCTCSLGIVVSIVFFRVLVIYISLLIVYYPVRVNQLTMTSVFLNMVGSISLNGEPTYDWGANKRRTYIASNCFTPQTHIILQRYIAHSHAQNCS